MSDRDPNGELRKFIKALTSKRPLSKSEMDEVVLLVENVEVINGMAPPGLRADRLHIVMIAISEVCVANSG